MPFDTRSEAQRLYDEHNASHSVRCPVCSKGLLPQKNGRVRNYKRDMHIGTFLRTEKCPGAGRMLNSLPDQRSTPGEQS